MSYYLVHTTYLVIFIAVFARQLCVPIPALLFLLSAGALAGSGKLSYAMVLNVAVLGSVLADLAWFEAGRLQGERVLRLLCALASDPSYCIRRAKTAFSGKGLRLLYVAKFIPGLDAVCPPLAGMTGASRIGFIWHDAIGSGLWAALYISLGFFFAKELDRVNKYITDISDGLLFVLVPPLFVFIIWKLVVLIRHIKLLRAHQVTPEMLNARIEAGERLGIIDLLRFEDDPGEKPGIPGAVRLEPSELRGKRRIMMPPDLEVIIYCRSKNNFASARVAAVMRKHGVRNISVLVGGLAAWQSQGYPVSSAFAAPADEMERLGVVSDPPWKPKSR